MAKKRYSGLSVFNGGNIGYIRNPFNSFKKKTQLGALKTGCFGCEGCSYEFFGSTASPCCNCTHNIKNKNNSTAQNYYEKK